MTTTWYVVVTTDRQPGLLPETPAPPRWRSARVAKSWRPVGVRHAVPMLATVSRAPRTLCGLDADGWHTWPGMALTGGHGADCMRCAQVAARAEPP